GSRGIERILCVQIRSFLFLLRHPSGADFIPEGAPCGLPSSGNSDIKTATLWFTASLETFSTSPYTRPRRTMMGLLEAIEASGISTWIRESRSLFAYPMVLTLHTFGLAIIVGSSAVVDLRLLGFGAHIPLKPLKTLFPIMWIGFGINAFSGLLLLARGGHTVGVSGVFWTKIALIALSMWVLVRIKHRVFDAESSDARPIPNDARLLDRKSTRLNSSHTV